MSTGQVAQWRLSPKTSTPRLCDGMFLVKGYVTHCLQTQPGRSEPGGAVVGSHSVQLAAMPCRKESFLLLEQSVTVGSKEVDTLVARIGEALQLNAQRTPASCGMGYGALKPPSIPRPPAHCSCVRGRATPYPVCTPRGAGRGSRHQDCGGNKQLCGRGWLRGVCRKHGQQGEEDEDPHQLLQELLLNGNLIKEAVRRLHLAAERPTEPAETTVP